MNTSAEKDINDIFDDIVLTEEKIFEKEYYEGFAEGEKQGKLEGYQLGYAKGVELANELGGYYGTAVAYIKLTNTEKIRKSLEVLKDLIEKFPKSNCPDADILGQLENIRTHWKKVQAMLKLSPSRRSSEEKDYSF